VNTLRGHLADYLTLRRALGFHLVRSEKLLVQFLDFCDTTGAENVTVQAALTWATAPGGSNNWHAYRLGAVRGFACYLHGLDPAHQIPPAGTIPSRPTRATPYLYSDTEISALMEAAGSLRSPLRRATYATLIGLLATTGMRVGEAIAADRDAVDLTDGIVTIRAAKGGKDRLLPLHPTTTAALADYLRLRDRLTGPADPAALFVSPAGTRLLYCNVHATFARLLRIAGLAPRSAACRPRIHDLRHRFAVATMLDWYRNGADAGAGMVTLSTYLGHADPAATYWYLSAAPELLGLAAGRLDPGAPR
jgi:integrase